MGSCFGPSRGCNAQPAGRDCTSEDHMQQFDLPLSGRGTLTRDAVVDELVLRLRQRSTIAARRRAAYLRLAWHILQDGTPAASISCGRQEYADRLLAA